MKKQSSGGCCKTSATDLDIKNIYTVLLIVSMFMILELWGHWHSNSLSLLADSIHLFVDLLGFLISIVSLRLTKKAEDKKMTFGYHRFEVIGALFSVFFIWIATGYLIFEAYNRYKNPKEIKEKVFFCISIIGLIVNIICLFCLHRNKHSHEGERASLNIRATYVHVIGDIIQSLGVILASIIIFFYPKLTIVDIYCTILFAIIVLFSTFSVLKEVFLILSESVPIGIKIEDLRSAILDVNGVEEILELRVWSLAVNKHACMVTILLEGIFLYDYEEILLKTKKVLKDDFQLKFISVQIETKNTKEYNLLENGVI